MSSPKRVVIVGGGMAGLSCASRIHMAGGDPIVVEASDLVGGRVRTDLKDGFRLDRGFQVYLSAYPETAKLLNLKGLDLRPFKAGALIFENGKFRRMMDVFRYPQATPQTAFQPIGSIKDKLLVGLLRFQARRTTVDAIWRSKDGKTEAYLRDFGFSEGMIDQFFRGFYGGIFLERELRTSSRMFRFTFKMFSQGFATIPALGMGEIPRQIAQRLPAESIRLKTRVRSVDREGVNLESGERLTADAVVVATDGENTARLLTRTDFPQVHWRATTTLYFSAPESPIREPLIALRGRGAGIVNSVCVPSDLSSHYAPPGRSLLSVSALGVSTDSQCAGRVRRDLVAWFGEKAASWDHLCSYEIRNALPEQLPSNIDNPTFRVCSGVYICGDHCSSASIEGAVISGRDAADAIVG